MYEHGDVEAASRGHNLATKVNAVTHNHAVA